jgi:hypothetical protein
LLDAGCWMLAALARTLACLMFFAYGGLNRFHY